MMATVTTCPSCSEKLRLPDSLRGQQGRCPQCTKIFEATESPPAPPPMSAPVPRTNGVDVPFQLSLDGPDSAAAPASSPSSSSRSKPIGAVELHLSLDDDSPKAPT